MIDKPGRYDMPTQEYHADPAPEPSLSKSIAHVLLECTPAHARLAHPRLNPAHEPDTARVYDLGAAAHAIMGGEDSVHVIFADDFRTKAAREERDTTLAAGFNPVLEKVYDQAQAMVRSARAQLARTEEGARAFEPDHGLFEQSLFWHRDGIWCRIRIDWLPHEGGLIWDYKTTSASANPAVWGKRSLYDHGSYLSDAAYGAGVKRVLGLEGWRMRFAVQETEPPYALSVIALDPAALAYAEAQWHRAVTLWRFCLTHGWWPGYPGLTAHVGLPPWREREYEDLKLREELAREESGKSLVELGIEMQKPLEARK